VSQPIGNDPAGNGGGTNPFGNGAPGTTAATGASKDVLPSLFGPLTTIFAGITANFYNTCNNVLNSVWFAGCAVVGFIVCAIGLWGLTKDTPLGGVTQGIGHVAKKGAEIVGLAALL
jgi:hypothetical protein